MADRGKFKNVNTLTTEKSFLGELESIKSGTSLMTGLENEI